MRRLALALALLVTACSGVPTAPNELVALGNVRNTATAQAQSTQVASFPITESAANAQYQQGQTATYQPASLTSTAVANLQAVATVEAAKTQSARDTFSYTSTLAFLPTAISATGTALALDHAQKVANTKTAEAVSNLAIVLGSIGGVLALALAAALGYWVWGRAQADVTRCKTQAENSKPHVFGNVLVLPTPSGGFTHHPIIVSSLPSLPPPTRIENRDIPINGSGAGELHVSSPVNDHEREWRTALVQSALIFQEKGTASPDLCGKGKPFSSATHWKEITDRLADNGLLLKDNGGATLPVGKWGEIIARLQDANKPLRLPANRPPRLRVFSLENHV